MQRLMGLLQRQFRARREFAERGRDPEFFLEIVSRLSREIADERTDQFIETERCQASLRSDQTNGKPLNHADCDLGTFDTHRLEGLPVQLDQLGVPDRHRARGTGLPEDYAHLAKEITRSQLRHDSRTRGAAARYLDLPSPNDVEIDALVALIEDDLAVLETALKGTSRLNLCRFSVAQDCSPRRAAQIGTSRRVVVFVRCGGGLEETNQLRRGRSSRI